MSIVRPAAARGERVLVLAEDWQVVPAVLTLDRTARDAGLRDALTMAWNANNTYGFHTIDFHALARARATHVREPLYEVRSSRSMASKHW